MRSLALAHTLAPTLALAAAVALLGLTGTAATAQAPTKSTTTVTTPTGTATTTTRTHMDGMSGKIDERSTTRTKTSTVTRNGHMATAHASRRCKTWWKHGKKMRSCRTMTRVHHMG